jgi:hypothetical protein
MQNEINLARARRRAVLGSTLSLIMVLWASAAGAVTGTFRVTETWSARLEYNRFGRDRFTGTRTFSGTQSGTIRIVDGRYQILDRAGIDWSSPGRDLKRRTLTLDEFSHCIDGDYPFAPVFGAQAYGLVFLGCFAVKVPLVDGEVPVFTRVERTSGCDSSLTSIQCSGNMLGVSLKAYVSSTVSLREVIGPPTIHEQPRSQSTFESQSVTFRVGAGGSGTVGYFWRKGTVALPGANEPSLTLTNLQLADAGGYSVIVSNAGGKVTSATAQLTVRRPPPPWFEGWESAAVRAYVPSTDSTMTTFIPSDGGRWARAGRHYHKRHDPANGHDRDTSQRRPAVPAHGHAARHSPGQRDGRTGRVSVERRAVSGRERGRQLDGAAGSPARHQRRAGAGQGHERKLFRGGHAVAHLYGDKPIDRTHQRQRIDHAQSRRPES